jgi:hypothetical protein
MTPSGIDPVNMLFVAQCVEDEYLNKLRKKRILLVLIMQIFYAMGTE